MPILQLALLLLLLHNHLSLRLLMISYQLPLRSLMLLLQFQFLLRELTLLQLCLGRLFRLDRKSVV